MIDEIDEKENTEPETDESVSQDVKTAGSTAPVVEKEKSSKGFFGTHKLAIGIVVLIVLLGANVAVLGANIHMNKMFRGGPGGMNYQKEYMQGQWGPQDQRGPQAQKGPQEQKRPQAQQRPGFEYGQRGDRAPADSGTQQAPANSGGGAEAETPAD